MLAVIVFVVVPVALLALSIPLIWQLRSLDDDRSAGRRTVATLMGATGTRVLYSVLVVLAYAVLPLLWAVEALSTVALLAFLTAPLAMRLGDTVSHRSGAALGGAAREAFILLLAFGAILILATAVRA